MFFCFFFVFLGLNEVFTVTKGGVQQIFINNSIRAVGTAKESKGIVVTGMFTFPHIPRNPLYTDRPFHCYMLNDFIRHFRGV